MSFLPSSNSGGRVNVQLSVFPVAIATVQHPTQPEKEPASIKIIAWILRQLAMSFLPDVFLPP